MPVLLRTERLKTRSVDPAMVRVRAERMLSALALPQHELSLLLTDDSLIHELNRSHRGKDRPTDVLAFPLAWDDLPPATVAGGVSALGAGAQPVLLGDVVISLETAKRQAQGHRCTIVAEVTMLLAHGLLHLVGWDHRTPDETQAMNREVEQLVTRAVDNVSSARRPRRRS